MDADARAKLIAETMRSSTLTREQASVLVDMSKHAFETSVEAAMRILDTAPMEMRVAALASVAGSWLGVLKEHFPEHWKAVQANPNAIDEPTVIVLPPRNQRESN